MYSLALTFPKKYIGDLLGYLEMDHALLILRMHRENVDTMTITCIQCEPITIHLLLFIKIILFY